MVKSLEQRKLERQGYDALRQKRWEEAYNQYIESIEQQLDSISSSNEQCIYIYIVKTFDFEGKCLVESIAETYKEKGFKVKSYESTPNKPDSNQLVISGW